MPRSGDSKKQGNQYDKIFKENLVETLPVIVETILGLPIVSYEELVDTIQHTKERKPDVLKKVTDSNGDTYILHLEFQVSDDSEMVYRMAEYAVMLMRIHKLPLRQFVLFLKDIKPTMATELQAPFITYSYPLIRLADYHYKLFLNSENPTVKMLGFLANFGQDNAYQVITEVLASFHKPPLNDLSASKYMRQFRVIMQLRKGFELEFIRAMESISKYFKEEQDILYQKGEAQGIAKGEALSKVELIKRLLFSLEFTDEQAAVIADVDINQVRKIRAAGI